MLRNFKLKVRLFHLLRSLYEPGAGLLLVWAFCWSIDLKRASLPHCGLAVLFSFLGWYCFLEYEPGPMLPGAKLIKRKTLTWLCNAWDPRMFSYFNVMQIWVNTLAKNCKVVRSTALYLLVTQTQVIYQVVFTDTWQIW